MNTRERFVTVMNFRQPDRKLLLEMGYQPDLCHYRRRFRALIEKHARKGK